MKLVMFVGCHAGIRGLLAFANRAYLTCSAVAPVFSLGSRFNSREAVAILKLPLLLTPLTYIPIGNAVGGCATPAA
jgi:hypothetical protein